MLQWKHQDLYGNLERQATTVTQVILFEAGIDLFLGVLEKSLGRLWLRGGESLEEELLLMEVNGAAKEKLSVYHPFQIVRLAYSQKSLAQQLRLVRLTLHLRFLCYRSSIPLLQFKPPPMGFGSIKAVVM